MHNLASGVRCRSQIAHRSVMSRLLPKMPARSHTAPWPDRYTRDEEVRGGVSGAMPISSVQQQQQQLSSEMLDCMRVAST